MAAFRDSIEAFMHAIDSEKDAHGAGSLQVRCTIGSLWNGMTHCSVQVHCGIKGYCIDAYGEEAHELYRIASSYSTTNMMTAAPVRTAA
jgi:hypothetical protein